MLSEYAVEPAAIGADWRTFKDLIDRFGADRGRLISRLPVKWEKKVIQAARDAGVPDVRMTDIVERFPQLSRFGVMKHLKVLEDAHLIVTRKDGRFKHHYLNPLPLQEMVDRWVDPFLKQKARAISALKTALENPEMKPDFVMETFIDCSHDALWDALTKGELVAQYHFACEAVEGDFAAPGDVVDYTFPSGDRMLTNRVIAIEPKTRIEMSFEPHWGEDRTASRCVYLVTPGVTGMKLTLEHYGLTSDQDGIRTGWARFASGLKTWLETGKTHRFAPEMA